MKMKNAKEYVSKLRGNKKFLLGIFVSALIALVFVLSISYSSGYASGQESMKETITQRENSVAELTSKNEELEEERRVIQEELDTLDIDFRTMEAEYGKYQEKMKPYEGLAEADAEAQRLEKERQIAEERERKEEEAARQKAEEEERKAEEAAQKEAEEKQGYETGITYDQLARTPDGYIGNLVKFSGKVVQVIEGDGYITIRFAVNDDYDTILLAEYDPSIVSSRILEDDYITIYGMSMGLYTYEATMGHSITVPSVLIDKIDQ